MTDKRERVPFGDGGHTRDGLGICARCGNGYGAREVLDGEYPCGETITGPAHDGAQREYLIRSARLALEQHDRRMTGPAGGRGVAPTEQALAVALRGMIALAVQVDELDEETICRLILGRTAPSAARAVTEYIKGPAR